MRKESLRKLSIDLGVLEGGNFSGPWFQPYHNDPLLEVVKLSFDHGFDPENALPNNSYYVIDHGDCIGGRGSVRIFQSYPINPKTGEILVDVPLIVKTIEAVEGEIKPERIRVEYQAMNKMHKTHAAREIKFENYPIREKDGSSSRCADCYLLFTEYSPGITFNDIRAIKDLVRGLDLKMRVDAVISLLSSLQRLHSKTPDYPSFLHGDINKDNVAIAVDDRLRNQVEAVVSLFDYGEAQEFSGGFVQIEEGYRYSAHPMIHGVGRLSGQLTLKSDIYSLVPFVALLLGNQEDPFSLKEEFYKKNSKPFVKKFLGEDAASNRDTRKRCLRSAAFENQLKPDELEQFRTEKHDFFTQLFSTPFLIAGLYDGCEEPPSDWKKRIDTLLSDQGMQAEKDEDRPELSKILDMFQQLKASLTPKLSDLGQMFKKPQEPREEEINEKEVKMRLDFTNI